MIREEDIWEQFSMSKFASRSDRDLALVREIIRLGEQIGRLSKELDKSSTAVVPIRSWLETLGSKQVY